MQKTGALGCSAAAQESGKFKLRYCSETKSADGREDGRGTGDIADTNGDRPQIQTGGRRESGWLDPKKRRET